MKADIILFISPETPLTKQISKIFGRLCSMFEFTTVSKDEKFVTLKHFETGMLIAYTTEERLKK